MPIEPSDSTKHRRNKRANGYCAWNGCPNISNGAYLCPDHAAKSAEYQAAWRDRRRANKAAAKAAVAAAEDQEAQKPQEESKDTPPQDQPVTWETVDV